MTAVPIQRVALFIVLPALSLLWLFHSMSVLDRNVGPAHDELWDYAPAVRMLNGEAYIADQEIQILGRPFPLVSGPYQGAQKTWFTAPLILVFGHDIRSFRSINVLLSAIYLTSLAWCLAGVTGNGFALIVFIIPFVDSHFLLAAPMDFGPFLVTGVSIALSLGASIRYLTRGKLSSLWLAAFFCGLTLASKLTSIPAVLTILLLLAAAAREPVKRLWGQGRRMALARDLVLLPFALFLIPLIPHLIYLEKAGFAALLDTTRSDAPAHVFQKLFADCTYFAGSFNGLDWSNRLTGASQAVSFGGGYFVSVSLCLLLVIAAGCSFRREVPVGNRRLFLGILGLFLAALVLFSLFKGLNRPWHYDILSPFFWTAVFAGVWVLGKYSPSRIFRALLAAFLVGTAAVATAGSIQLLASINRNQGAGLTSPAIDLLPGILQAEKFRKVYCLNYSLSQPIYTLSGGRLDCVDLAWGPFTADLARSIVAEAAAHRDVAIVYRSIAATKGTEAFTGWLNRNSDVLTLAEACRRQGDMETQQITDRQGTHFYIISRRY